MPWRKVQVLAWKNFSAKNTFGDDDFSSHFWVCLVYHFHCKDLHGKNTIQDCTIDKSERAASEEKLPKTCNTNALRVRIWKRFQVCIDAHVRYLVIFPCFSLSLTTIYTIQHVLVLFHASSIGRTDVVQNAIGALRSSGASEQELLALISTGRPEDDATPLHLAAAAGHSDVIRYLLVCETNFHVLLF